MSSESGLIGICYWGGGFFEGNELQGEDDLIAVSTSKAALGIELNMFCTEDYPDVPNEPSDTLIDVVIGDPYLLKKVKVVARGDFGTISLPDDVREAFDWSTWIEDTTEIIVFENEDGILVYIMAWITTLLENVIDRIDEELLEEA